MKVCNENLYADFPEDCRSFILSLRLLGLYYLDKYQKAGTRTSNMYLAYSVFVIVIVISNFIRFIFVLPNKGNLDDIIVYSSAGIWALYVLIHGLIMFALCARKSGWRAFFISVAELQRCPMAPKPCNFKRRVNIYVLASWLIFIINMSSYGYLLFFTKAADTVHVPMETSHQVAFLHKVFILVVHVFSSGVWVFSLTIFFVVTDLVGNLFRTLNGRLEEASRKDPVQFREMFPTLKNLHQKLCDLVDSADSLLTALLAGHIIFNLILLCGVMYFTIYNPLQMTDIMFFVSASFWFFASVAILLIATGASAWLKEQVRLLFNTPFFHYNYWYCMYT